MESTKADVAARRSILLPPREEGFRPGLRLSEHIKVEISESDRQSRGFCSLVRLRLGEESAGLVKKMSPGAEHLHLPKFLSR